jgi:hypothetical protein
MEKKEFKKYFNSRVKTLIEKFNSPNISMDFSQNTVSIMFSNKVIGQIEFNFLTNKQLSVNAFASIFVSAHIYGGEIWEEIIKNKLLKKKSFNPYTNYLYYFYSSSSNNYLFKNAKTDFLSSENIEDKTDKFLDFISKELLNKICNIVEQKAIAVDNILETPNFYGQPEISILILCRNSHNNELILSVEKDKRFLNSSSINKKIWEENKTILFKI